MPPPAPQHCPTPRELDDLELLVSGAYEPTTRFNEPGSPVTLTLPPELLDAPEVELVDPEGLPLARVTTDGEVTPLTYAQFGPFRELYLSPEQARSAYAGRTFVPVTSPLTSTQTKQVEAAGPVVLLALVGAGTPALSPVGLIRATRATGLHLDASVLAVPLASHGDPDINDMLRVRVVGNYAGTDPVLDLTWSTTDNVEAYPGNVAAILDFEQPPVDRQGLVLFFTGLSGSGKSTLARALTDRILEQGRRTVTSLDGDVVRRNLSAGLTFSKEDRETNIRRIGWVAAEIARHGGVAVCSPIAPFAETRHRVREMVETVGGAFFLVHVATPLEECERRDRKGLYAKARRGEIPEFTGISSPYEEPDDAAVRVDTTGRSIEEALDDVLVGLAEHGYLDLVPKQEAAIEVLFVCTANICRSPFMELLSRRLAGDDRRIRFASAGTHGFESAPMEEDMAATLTAREVDQSGFTSRRLTAEMITDADLVVTAETAHRSFILDDHPEAFRKVFGLGQLTEAVQRLESRLSGRELLAELGARRVAAHPEQDIMDPFRRGPEAAAECATRIATMLEIVVPVLSEPTVKDAP